MALIIQTPWPGPVSMHYAPNPLQGDSVGSTNTMEIKRSMNGTRYSYVKSKDQRKRLVWTVRLSKAKALELRAFFDSYNGSQVKVTLQHTGKDYIGYFTTNPFEFETVGRASSSPGNSTLNQIQIEFQGYEA